MSSFLETLGLSRGQTEANDGLGRETSEETSCKRASGQTQGGPVGFQGRIEPQIISLLEPVRELDWLGGVSGEQNTARRRMAATLHSRGEAVDPCVRCSTGGGVWGTCVVFPIYHNQSISSYACSNCIYNHNPQQCSHRQSFEAQGGKPWTSKLSTYLSTNGGLRSVLANEAQSHVPPSYTPVNVETKRKRPADYTDTQTQTQTARKKPSPNPVPIPARSEIRTAFDGKTLPWPVSPAAWNDVGKLRSIAEDLESFSRITKARIAKLESETERLSSAGYWDQEAAMLFSDGTGKLP